MTVTNNHVLVGQLKEYFGLNADPFSVLSPVFFGGAQRQHNLETLRHLATFGDMVLLLTGEKGAGKTSLIQYFERNHEDGLKSLTFDVGQSVSGKSVVNSAVQYFAGKVGLTPVRGESIQQTLSKLTQTLDVRFQQDGYRTLLIIDNAERLPRKELQIYFAYFRALAPESGVAVLFVGLPVLLQYAKLGGHAGREDWVHQIQIKPLNKEDLLGYLQLRLESAGYRGDLSLSDLQVRHLVDVGKGLPGRINKIFPSVVMEPGLLKVGSIKRSALPKQVFAGVGGLLLMSFLFVSYQHGLFNFEGEQLSDVLEIDSGLNQSAIISSRESGLLKLQQAERLAMLDRAIASSTKFEPAGSNFKGEVDGASGPEVQKTLQGEREGESVVQRVGQVLPQETVQKVDQGEAEAVAQKESQSTEQNEAKEVLTKHIESKLVLKSSAQGIIKPKNSYFRSREWAESQSVEAYSAQILASYKEDTALKFIDKLGDVQHDVFYLKTLHKGKSWYAVFYGVFPHKKAARAAISASSQVIRSQSPWLRRFDGIQGSYPNK